MVKITYASESFLSIYARNFQNSIEKADFGELETEMSVLFYNFGKVVPMHNTHFEKKNSILCKVKFLLDGGSFWNDPIF